MDLTAFNAVLFGFFIAAVVVAGLVFILRYMNWNGRNSRSVLQAVNTATVGGVNCSVLVSMALTAMHTWNWFFFPFVLILTWFLFLFFKIQSAPALFLPLQVRACRALMIHTLSCPLVPFFGSTQALYISFV